TLAQGVAVTLEDLPNPGPLRSGDRPPTPRPWHPQVLVLGLDAVGLDHLLPLLAEEAGVPGWLIGFKDCLLPALLDGVGAGDLHGHAVVPEEAHGPGVQVDHFEAAQALRAEG